MHAHNGGSLLKSSTIGIGLNGAETNYRIAHILDMWYSLAFNALPSSAKHIVSTALQTIVFMDIRNRVL